GAGGAGAGPGVPVGPAAGSQRIHRSLLIPAPRAPCLTGFYSRSSSFPERANDPLVAATVTAASAPVGAGTMIAGVVHRAAFGSFALFLRQLLERLPVQLQVLDLPNLRLALVDHGSLPPSFSPPARSASSQIRRLAACGSAQNIPVRR